MVEIVLSNEQMAELTERMGEAVHNAWMDKRKREKNWHSPEQCVFVDGQMGDGRHCVNCHPCMRPYSELPDAEKELDRNYPTMFFGILNEMGYVVVKDNGDTADAMELAKKLWMLLDDIDTLTDRMRPKKNGFYKGVYDIISRRHGKVFKPVYDSL